MASGFQDYGTGVRGVEKSAGEFRLTISDDGVGIDPLRLERPATLRALRQRTEALAAELQVVSSPGNGTQLALTVPLERKRRHRPLTMPPNRPNGMEGSGGEPRKGQRRREEGEESFDSQSR